MLRVSLCCAALAMGPVLDAQEEAPVVRLTKAPHSGFRPQAVLDHDGALHLLQGSIDARGDLFYLRREPGSASFSAPIRVNQTPGIVAASSMAVGKGGRVHVLIRPNPKYLKLRMPEKDKFKFFDLKYMLYTRLDDEGLSFEEERDLSADTLGFEGVGAVLADQGGQVYAFWHGQEKAQFDEPSRRIYRAHSQDEGRTFSAPEPVQWDVQGACTCCPIAGAWDADGRIALAFRNSRKVGPVLTKDAYLLVSKDHGKSFEGTLLDPWKEAGCPGSVFTLAGGPQGLTVGWRTKTEVRFAHAARPEQVVSPTSGAKTRLPLSATNHRGETLYAWAANPAKKPNAAGTLVWQLFGSDGDPLSKKGVHRNGIAERWGGAAVLAHPDGSFEILHDGQAGSGK